MSSVNIYMSSINIIIIIIVVVVVVVLFFLFVYFLEVKKKYNIDRTLRAL